MSGAKYTRMSPRMQRAVDALEEVWADEPEPERMVEIVAEALAIDDDQEGNAGDEELQALLQEVRGVVTPQVTMETATAYHILIHMIGLRQSIRKIVELWENIPEETRRDILALVGDE